MGGVLTASLLIAWATEVLSFFLSRGLAFAVLALLQVLPEFAVEAVITFQAAADPAEKLRFVTANFTGANRLIVGLFVPMVFFMAAYRSWKQGNRLRYVQLPDHTSVEIVTLMVPTLYSFMFVLRGQVTLIDAVVLVAIYATYLAVMYRLPSEHEGEEKLPLVPRSIRRQPVARQKLIIALFFLMGGGLLLVSVEPFIHNTIALGAVLGLSGYFLIQWLAPFLSEFPEFITIVYWGRTGRAELGLTNAISSKVNQWTLLIAMIPVVFIAGTYYITGSWTFHVPFDNFQRTEILLTATQGLFAACCFFNLRFHRWEAWTLIVLWGIQLFDPLLDGPIYNLVGDGFPTIYEYSFTADHPYPPYVREWTTIAYVLLAPLVLLGPKTRFAAWRAFKDVYRTHLRRQKAATVASDPHL